MPSTQCQASFNWSGYAVTGSTGSVTDVEGAWTVPAVGPIYGKGGLGSLRGNECTDSDVTWYDASFWVGIDGYSSNSVEQTGTSSDCFYGQLVYYAWYEFYPANSVTITTMTITPGDHMSAEVTYSPSLSRFTTMIRDLTTGKLNTTSTSVRSVSGAMENSAEWIAESAYGSQGILAFTDFSSVSFSGGSATISGVTQAISLFASNVQWLESINYNWPAAPGIKSTPTALTNGGTSFAVNWVSYGP